LYEWLGIILGVLNIDHKLKYMKKLLFLMGFVLVAGLSANAQDAAKKSCSKRCAKTCLKNSKTAMTSTDDATTKVASVIMTADAAAEADEMVQKRVCDKSGAVSFYQKSVCSHSGNVSWSEVEYCDKSQQFTKVAAASMERASADDAAQTAAPAAKKKSCAKSCAKTCSKKVKS
jgi:hypothetical protein